MSEAESGLISRESSAPFPWQESLWERLISAHREDRLAHAYLVAGPPGVGKRAFAQRFAASLLCLEPDARGHPCGYCRDCLLMRAGSHPDFSLLAPESGKTQIPIDAVRELSASLALAAHQGRYRVALILPAEAMTPQSANSLLKTLEEPGPGVILMLVSDRPLAVLPTLRSRCQRVDCPIPPENEVRGWLDTDRQDGALLARVLALSGGAPLQARSLLSGETAARLDRLGREGAQVLTGGADPLVIAARWAMEEPIDLVGLWLVRLAEQIAHLCILGHLPASSLLTLPTAQIQKALARADSRDVLMYHSVARQARLWLLQGTVNRQGLLESLLVPWSVGLRDFSIRNPLQEPWGE
jgi:DNA polymerase-3 subunit delta'